MNTPTKSNFLHKFFQKNQEQIDTLGYTIENSPQKLKWTRKLYISPSKIQPPPASPVRFVSPKTMNYQRRSDYTESKKISSAPKSPQSLLAINENMDVFDLEQVINDFETHYLSPTKCDNQPAATNKFVKKMVAIFERKGTSYKNLQSSKESSEYRKNITNIFHERSNDYFTPMGNTHVIEPPKTSHSDGPLTKLEPIDIYNYGKTPDEEVMDQSCDSTNVTTDTINGTPCDLPSSPPLDASLKRERAPKVIGAFLKKPIEVENTTIDWLPTPATKLPRKRSFTKFFTLLGGKKTYNSNNKHNLLRTKNCKEPKEAHDSGYDEKSISPASSLKSTSSFRNALLHEEKHSRDTNERISYVSSFQSLDPSPKEDSQTADDFFSNNNNINEHKIMFEDIPRSEVRLSLGPFYPIQPKLFIQSINRKDIITENTEEFEHENYSSTTNEYQNYTRAISPLPPYPVIHNNDEMYDIPNELSEEEEVEEEEECTEVELRRAADWTFPSSNNVYDVPKYFSASSPGLFTDHDNIHSHNNIYENMIMYNVPKITAPPRPKSSVYEDAQSLKRRTAEVTSTSDGYNTDLYASSSNKNNNYATIKPRKSSVLRNREFLCMERFKEMHTLTVPSNPDNSYNYSEITQF